MADLAVRQNDKRHTHQGSGIHPHGAKALDGTPGHRHQDSRENARGNNEKGDVRIGQAQLFDVVNGKQGSNHGNADIVHGHPPQLAVALLEGADHMQPERLFLMGGQGGDQIHAGKGSQTAHQHGDGIVLGKKLLGGVQGIADAVAAHDQNDNPDELIVAEQLGEVLLGHHTAEDSRLLGSGNHNGNGVEPPEEEQHRNGIGQQHGNSHTEEGELPHIAAGQINALGYRQLPGQKGQG
ncbi:hypothetical protein D3C75_748000 [compost metagenome]